ncbi:acyl-CoA dehydrogenase [Streptomyces sp. NRRL B-1347]|uniref:acyl-CoA dehydrogenase n=1 Tax=Streptomyces sp. NRRL B-1347 TaxID=1476877 RepID=UPI0004CB97EC|nr:acyl-CoA dehydrogenase [Streptomyces sp. NRRL B-1347]
MRNSHYRTNLRDIRFNLFELFGLEKVLKASCPELDADTAWTLVTEADRIAREHIAPSWAAGDRDPARLDPATGQVRVPEACRPAYQALLACGAWQLGLPEDLGGTPSPRLLRWAVTELLVGANPAVATYHGAPVLAELLHRHGTPQQQRLAQLMLERNWAATMVLTEAGAGSDVAAISTRAYPDKDGSWNLEGVKQFISGGDHDLAENIVHFVLARPHTTDSSPQSGTGGLSLFVVPKHRFDSKDGHLLGRNGITTTRVEAKLGLGASATCELAFGLDGTAQGWLVGERHDGLRQMFHAIRWARMLVGAKSVAALSSGSLNALGYARRRQQGTRLAHLGDPQAPRVTIIHHPDIRRSLLLQKAYAEGLRALFLLAASWQDRADTCRIRRDEAGGRAAQAVADLLLPVVKGCCSERATELLCSETLQVYGGAGYLRDHPAEQYLRDTRIDTIYEGTTAIQSLDLVLRRVVKDEARALNVLLDEVYRFTSAVDPASPLKDERTALREGAEHTRALFNKLRDLAARSTHDPDVLDAIGLHARRALLTLGDLLVGWLLARQAEIATVADAPSPAERAFHDGKKTVSRFFSREVLPCLAVNRSVVEGADRTVMDLAEDAF